MSTSPQGYTIWFTGLPGSGKSTLARRLGALLTERAISHELLDGDVVREDLCADLGFTPEDRRTNLRRVAFVARLLARHGVVAVCSFVSPNAGVRAELRQKLSPFVEVHVRCSVEECERRDPKGMYRRARVGEIARFTGVSAPYEAPTTPDVRVDTEAETEAESLARIVAWLEGQGLLPG